MGLFHKKGKNAILNQCIDSIRSNMENNYKDAAQADFEELKETYQKMVVSGALKPKERAYYDEAMAALTAQLAHFTHKEGPGTGKFNR